MPRPERLRTEWEFVGLDVKAIRTQRDDRATPASAEQPGNVQYPASRSSRTVNRQEIERYRQERDYEAMEMMLMKHIMNLK